MTTSSLDLFGRPTRPQFPPAQRVLPFELPSPLTAAAERAARQWRLARCPETAELFADRHAKAPAGRRADR